MLQLERPFGSEITAARSGETAAFGWVPDALSLLQRRWRTIALWALGVIALAVAYLFVATPRYTATASVLIDLRQADLFKQQSTGSDSQVMNSIVESQLELLKSESVALAVVRKLNLETDPEWNKVGAVGSVINGVISAVFGKSSEQSLPQKQLQAAENLIKNTTTRRIGLSNVIEVSVKSGNADLSANLANAVTSAYVTDQLEAKYDTTRRGSAWLQDRLGELRSQAIAADRAVQVYKARSSIVETDKGLVNDRQVGDLNALLIAARGRTSEVKARLDRINDIVRTGAADAAVADFISNPVIVKLRQEFLELTKKESEFSAKFGPNHSATINLRNQLGDLRRSFQAELKRTAEVYKSDYEVAQANEANTKRDLAMIVEQSSATNKERVELRDLESAAQTYRTLYETFLQRYTQAAQDQSFPISEARIVTSASPPLRKSQPQSLLILAGASLLGVAAGCGAALLRELRDRSLKSGREIETATGLNCIGYIPEIPRIGTRRTAPSDRRQAALSRTISNDTPMLRRATEQPFSPIAEVMQTAKVVIDRASPPNGCRVVGLVSAVPGEGKSTVSANLAHYIADTGYRTLLLDWDLRKSSLSRALAAESTTGILELVEGTAELDDVIWRDSDTNLDFIPTVLGGRLVHASGVFESPATARLMDELRARYDYILIDLPPLGSVVDARAASHLIDTFLLVIGWGRVNADMLKQCLSQSGFEETSIVGAVFNRVDISEVAQYGVPLIGYYDQDNHQRGVDRRRFITSE